MALESGRRKTKAGPDDREVGKGGQILPVADLPPNFDGIPLDGAQYLAVVRKQANLAPNVVRHDAYVSAIVESPSLQTGYRADSLPTIEWQKNFLSRFRSMRESFSHRMTPDGGVTLGVPQVSNPSKWFYFIYGVSSDQQASSAQIMPSKLPTLRQPSPSLLQRFYPMQLLALLRAITLWIDEDWKPRGFSTPESQLAISEERSRWIFAVLAHLDERLVGDDISTLRSLARCCIAKIDEGRKTSNAQLLPRFEHESGAWIVICAVIGIWGQHDLWNEASVKLSSS